MLKVHVEDICGEPTMMSGVVYPEVWCDEILNLAQLTGVPISAYVDEVKVGKGLAGFGVKPIPCVVVSHRDSPSKYVKMVGALDKMGNLTYASKYLAGSSASMRKQILANSIAAGMHNATGSGRNMLSSALNKMASRNQQKEQMYYDAVHNIMQEALDNAVGIQPAQSPAPTPEPQQPRPVIPPVSRPAPNPVTPPAPRPAPRPATPPTPRPAPRPSNPPVSRPASKPAAPAPKPAAEPEYIIFRCRKCNKQFRTHKRKEVLNFTCTQCGHKFRVDCSKNA